MAIYQILEEIKDVRKEGELCDFNGYLEDYLEMIDSSEDQPMKEILHALFEEDHDLKICVNLRADINRQVISNQIIRYKDAFKLQGHPVICPVIVYGKQEDAERALILVKHSDRSYLYAKGLYYTLTEPYSFLADCKNELVAVTAESVDGVLATFRKLFSVKAGALQREADRNRFSNYEQLKKDALDEAEAVKEILPSENGEDISDIKNNSPYHSYSFLYSSVCINSSSLRAAADSRFPFPVTTQKWRLGINLLNRSSKSLPSSSFTRVSGDAPASSISSLEK